MSRSKRKRRNGHGCQPHSDEARQVEQTFRAMFDEVFMLIESYGLNAHTWLTELLQACEDSGGHLANTDRFMSWNMTAADKLRLSQPRPFQVGGKIFQGENGKVVEVDAAGNRKKSVY